MIITAKSTFHGGLSQTFRVPAEPGRYPRRCVLACDGAKVAGTGIQIHCGCGWPCHRTEWVAPEEFVVYAEWNVENWSGRYERNNIVVVVEQRFTEEGI